MRGRSGGRTGGAALSCMSEDTQGSPRHLLSAVLVGADEVVVVQRRAVVAGVLLGRRVVVGRGEGGLVVGGANVGLVRHRGRLVGGVRHAGSEDEAAEDVDGDRLVRVVVEGVELVDDGVELADGDLDQADELGALVEVVGDALHALGLGLQAVQHVGRVVVDDGRQDEELEELLELAGELGDVPLLTDVGDVEVDDLGVLGREVAPEVEFGDGAHDEHFLSPVRNDGWAGCPVLPCIP